MPQHDIPVHRRPDGSIDTDFYARRAALLRHAALREAPARCIGTLAHLVAKLINAPRPSRTAGPGILRPRRDRETRRL